MVAKLIKYDLIAVLKFLAVLGAALILAATLTRISSLGIREGDISVFFTMSASIYMLLVFYTLLAAAFSGSARFTSLFLRGEGYLAFSLPVTPTQLIIAKLLTSVIGIVIAVVMCILSALILTVGMNEAQLAAAPGLFNNIESVFDSSFDGSALSWIEMIVFILTLLPMPFLCVASCASLAQLFTKNRPIITVLFILAAFFLLWAIGMFALSPLYNLCEEAVSPHFSNWLSIIVNAAFEVGLFFLVRYLLKHKVNLII